MPERDAVDLQGAFEQLRQRLLDLTARNRLLNFRHSQTQSLRLPRCNAGPTGGHAPLDSVYHRLVHDEQVLRLEHVPLPHRKDWPQVDGKPAKPNPRDRAAHLGIETSLDWTMYAQPRLPMAAAQPVEDQPGHADRLQVLLFPEELAGTCRRLQRYCRESIEETGAHVLFVVFGFLEYVERQDSQRTFTAPLYCVPVILERGHVDRATGHHRYTLRYTGEDLTENLSLREKLRHDFSLELPAFDSDGHAVLERYFKALDATARDRPGWSVRRYLSLTLLSFTRMLMIKDLTPSRWPTDANGNSRLVTHPTVRRVLTGAQRGAVDGGVTSELDVDSPALATLPLVHDADSSQHLALSEVVAGRDLVIEGPPGTGKSQTITNLIAIAIAAGKKVLFVAEKRAALEVVKRRLDQAGLGDFCLDLHAGRPHRKAVIEDIRARYNATYSTPPGLHANLQLLDHKRRTLRAVGDALNSVCDNRLEVSVRDVLGRVARIGEDLGDACAHLRDVYYPDAHRVDLGRLDEILRLLKRTGERQLAIRDPLAARAFAGFEPTTDGDEIRVRFEALLRRLLPSATDMQLATGELVAAARGAALGLTQSNIAHVLQAVHALGPPLEVQQAAELLPAMFPATDPIGHVAGALVASLRDDVTRLAALQASVSCALRPTFSPTAGDVETARRAHTWVSAYCPGVLAMRADDIPRLARTLQDSLDHMRQSSARAEGLVTRAGLRALDSIAATQRILAVAELAAAAPMDSLRWRHAGLIAPTARERLSRLRAERARIQATAARLDRLFYLDLVPSTQELDKAIATLQGGQRWYRFLQPEWRRARSVHRRFARGPQQPRATEQLQQMEQVREHLRSRRAFAQSTDLKELAGSAWQAEQTPLEELEALAAWLAQARTLQQTLDYQEHLNPVLSPDTHVRDLATMAPALREQCAALDSLSSALHGIGSPLLRVHQPLHEVVLAAEALGRGLVPLAALVKWGRDGTSVGALLAAVEEWAAAQELLARIAGDHPARQLLGAWYRGQYTDLAFPAAVLEYGRAVLAAELPPVVTSLLLTEAVHDLHPQLEARLVRLDRSWNAVREFCESARALGNFDLERWMGCTPDSVDVSGHLVAALTNALHHIGALQPLARYNVARHEARAVGASPLIELMEAGHLEPHCLSRAFEYVVYATLAKDMIAHEPLRSHAGSDYNSLRHEFADLDRQVIRLRGKECAALAARAARPPSGSTGIRVDDKTEMALLHHVFPQAKPRVTVRRLLARAGCAVSELKPCFMMSPQGVAQFLEPGALEFDIVVMDEASQLKPEEALGAIARGRQLVVVGDPKQLPPTSFFDKWGLVEDDTSLTAVADAESILDVCIGHFAPTRLLRWHYRSRHESLIAFSNAAFYRHALLVPPAPEASDESLGVHFVHVADAEYRGQQNRIEAERVVAAAVNHIARRPDRSLGIVALNLKQRDLIDLLLDRRLLDLPAYADFRRRHEADGLGLFVKNLENVQGDERDVIFVSTTFGREPGTGVVRQNFGPISRATGWRRLNVLFTRARLALHVFSSMLPEDIVDDATTPEGTRVLRQYLAYARSGAIATPSQTSQDCAESDFELAVADTIRSAGYAVVPQLGVSGFRIDIAVKDPAGRGYLAAIECDGATFHRAMSVRDRDRIRQEILEAMGWRGLFWRIWSTDWFQDSANEKRRLLAFLERQREAAEARHKTAQPGPNVQPAAADTGPPPDLLEDLEETDEREVKVGDTIVYAPVEAPDQEITVQISRGEDSPELGVIGSGKPLAQTLLGATVGGEVVLRIPGYAAKRFVVKRITPPVQATSQA